MQEKKINEKQKARVFSYEYFTLQKEKFRLYFVKHLGNENEKEMKFPVYEFKCLNSVFHYPNPCYNL